MDELGKKQQLAIGVFVLMAIASAAILVAVFGKSSGLQGTYSLYCEIESTGGPINKGAPVRMMGIPVGKVNKIKLNMDLPKPTVRLDVEIYDEYAGKIMSDSFLRVEQSTLIGDRVVEIYPGTLGTPLKDGEKIDGKVSVNIDEVISDARKTVAGLNQATDDLHTSFAHIDTIIGDEDFVKDIHASAKEIHEAAKNINHLLGSGEDMVATTKDFVEQLSGTGDVFEQILIDIAKGKGSLGRLIEDDEFVDELQDTLKEVRRLVSDLKSDPSQMFWGKERQLALRKLTLSDIESMVKAGLKASTIVSQIEACGQQYELTADKILELKKKGFEDLILESMILNGR